MLESKELKKRILGLTREYYSACCSLEPDFVPGRTRIHYGGRYYDDSEMVNLVDAALDFWLTAGPWAQKFEKRFAQWLGVKYCSLCNSGSSANLLAFSALTASELGCRAIRRGDEVITVAAGFPTTVACMVQLGAVPVFVDVNLADGNIDASKLESALSSKTKAVMIAHSLGNPFPVQEVLDFCRKYGLWLVEDNCDALGSECLVDGVWKKTGTIGDIGTSSFYPPHHMTMGEGGAVYTNNPSLDKYVKSFRDWGRDCWCIGGVDNTCGHRFSGQYGLLTPGYDHKYVYSRLGYNLKATDLQAAIGCAQLEKLGYIVQRRRENFAFLHKGLEGVPGLILPTAQKDSKPSWFGFLIIVEKDAGFTRNELTAYLEKAQIQTRNLFAGNLLKHPAFAPYRPGKDYRVVGNLTVTNRIMSSGFWLGVYPGLTEEKLQYVVDTIKSFVTEKLSGNV